MTENQAEPTVEELQREIEEVQQALEQARQDLRTQRKTVVDVAQKYARQNSMCEVVDEALREAGMLMPPTEKVISIEVPMQVRIGIDDEATKNMSEAELKETLSKIGKINGVNWEMNQESSVGSVVSVANGNRRHQQINPVTEIGEIRVIDITDPPPPAVTGGEWTAHVELPAGYVLRYTRPEGRKAHLVRVGHERTALCGAENSYGDWTQTSPRAELVNYVDGICQSCRQRSVQRHSRNVRVRR